MRGRNSDNTVLKEVIGWQPEIKIQEGIKYTYDWIAHEMARRIVTTG